MRLAHLFDFLFPPRTDDRLVRDLSPDIFLDLMRPMLVPETRPATTALLPFSDPRVRGALHEAKYHGSEHAFSLLAAILHEYLIDLDLMSAKHIGIIPVPLGNKRQKERGFNQVEEVVKRALRDLPIDLETDLLIRTRETVSQVSLPRNEREENMKGAFKSTRAADPFCTYILVDDVLTTGATLQAAITALQRAGAPHILPLALAH